MDKNKKRVLVTGGAGFIGSNLCKKLLNNGDYVICLDNLYASMLLISIFHNLPIELFLPDSLLLPSE